MRFLPGYGFHFDQLTTQGAKVNTNFCDLQGVDTLGTASITAEAKYPYQPVVGPKHKSDPVEKVIENRFNKVLSFTVEQDQSPDIFLLTAWFTDIDGQPNRAVINEYGYVIDREKELACWTAEGDGHFTFALDPEKGGDYYFEAEDDDPLDLDRVCTKTNENGVTQLKYVTSFDGATNIIAEFTDERIFRSIDVGVGLDQGTPPPPKGDKPGKTNPKVGNPSAAELAAAGIDLVAIGNASYNMKKAKVKRFFKVKRKALLNGDTRKVKRFTKATGVFRVNGPENGQARLKVQLLNANGVVVSVKRFWVDANQKEKVTLLKAIKKNGKIRANIHNKIKKARNMRVTILKTRIAS